MFEMVSINPQARPTSFYKDSLQLMEMLVFDSQLLKEVSIYVKKLHKNNTFRKYYSNIKA